MDNASLVREIDRKLKVEKAAAAILLIAGVCFPLYFHYQENRPPTIVFDGVTWTQVFHWAFKDVRNRAIDVGQSIGKPLIEFSGYPLWGTRFA